MPVQEKISIEVHFDERIMGANFLVLEVDEKGKKTVTAKVNYPGKTPTVSPVTIAITRDEKKKPEKGFRQENLDLDLYLGSLENTINNPEYKGKPKYKNAKRKIYKADMKLTGLLKAFQKKKLSKFDCNVGSFYLYVDQDKKLSAFDRWSGEVKSFDDLKKDIKNNIAAKIKDPSLSQDSLKLFLEDVTRLNALATQLQPERKAKIEELKVEEPKIEEPEQSVSRRKKGGLFKRAAKGVRNLLRKNSSAEITSPSEPQESIEEQPVIKPREAAPLPPQQRGPAPLSSQQANIPSDYETVDNFEDMEGSDYATADDFKDMEGSDYATADDFDDASPSPRKPDAIKEGPKNLDVTLLYSGSFMVHYGEDIYTLADFEKKYSDDQDLIIGVWDKVALLKASMKEDMIKDAHGSMTEEEAEKQINQQLQTAISDSKEDIYSIPHTSPDLPPRSYTDISRLKIKKVEIENAIERIKANGIDSSMQAQAMNKLRKKEMSDVTLDDIIGLLKEQIEGIEAQIERLKNPKPTEYATLLSVLPEGSDNIEDAIPLAETAQEESDKIVYAELMPQAQTETLYETVENVVQELSQPESFYSTVRDVTPHTALEERDLYVNLAEIQKKRREATEKKAADPEGHYANFEEIKRQREDKPKRPGK